MTTDLAGGRRVGEWSRSVRQHLAAVPATTWWLVGVLALTVLVHGSRILGDFFIRGDLLYHWGVANTILLGAFPPEGPYAGLPTYYPPGFHLILAGLARVLATDLPTVTAILSIAWLPVIPLGMFLLGRRLTGRPDVAVVASAFAAFAGGFDLSPDRLWVGSMSMVGHVAYPIYPRDLVFGVLPFVMLAFLRAIDGRPRGILWAVLAGVLLGICGLIQVQLLLPIPVAIAAYVAVLAWRRPDRRAVAIGALLITGLIAVIIIGPWLAFIVATIGANGGVSIDSSENLLPARIGFWSYPIQFGLLLPLAVLGAGVALLFLRRPDGPRPGDEPGRWAPDPPEGAMLLLPWWVVPFALAVLYQPTWPLEDALRPQRMWLVASQPALILAAMGLFAATEDLVARRPRWRRLAAPLVVGAVLAASLPATVATERLLWLIWSEPRYAHLRLVPDRVPDMAALLRVEEPRPTVLTYEDWSSLVWYETGAAVVAVEPPGYAKLAFDPGVFTGHGQADRRADLAAALRGDVTDLTRIADEYGADRVVLARRGGNVGLIGQPATVAAQTGGAVTGVMRPLQGNGWDALVMEPGSRLALPVTATGGPVELELRLLSRVALPVDETGTGTGTEADDDAPIAPGVPGVPSASPARFRLVAGDRPVAEVEVRPDLGADFVMVPASVHLEPGERLTLEAIDRIAVQSVTGFVPDPGPPEGWRVVADTVDALVWERVP